MDQEWTIPLTIRVSLGTPVPGASLPGTSARVTSAAAEASRTEEALPSYLDKFSLASLDATTFGWRTALSLALASRLAYSGRGDVESTARNVWGLQTCTFVDVDDTQCFVAKSANATLLSFRGTEQNLGDWMGNLNSTSTTRPYGSVHRGFLSAFQVVQQRLESLIGNDANRPLVLTGHSLGGALALIAAAEWRTKYRITALHTFGQPTVGKGDFCNHVNGHFGGRYFRFFNNNDIVPQIPPWFSHCGSLLRFRQNSDLENVFSEERVALGIDAEAAPEDTPMMSEEEFNLLRARLLQEEAAGGGAPVDDASLQRAVAEVSTVAKVAGGGRAAEEGLFDIRIPSVGDHKIDLYIGKCARRAGF